MDKKFYAETVSMKDGKVLLYKRPNSKNYQCRLLVTGINHYIIKSCKTKNLGEASRFAEDLYDKYRYKILNHQPLVIKKFNQIFDDFISKVEKSKYRKSFCLGTHKRYFAPYFGKYNIDEINTEIANNYFLWRKNFYKLHPEMINGNAAETPSHQTLKMEKSLLKEIFNYAFTTGYINQPVVITYKNPKKEEQRDAFEEYECKKMLELFKKWSEGKTDIACSYQRKMVYNLVLFLVNTGIRANEYYKLKWSDVTPTTEKGIDLLNIRVANDTKTGHRTVVSTPEAYTAYQNLKKFSKYQKPEDYFFTNYDGSCFRNSSKTFITQLKEWNLYISKDGKKRPYYSLRHTYATQRIRNNVDVYALALNMGTSVKQIENHYSHVLAIQRTPELIKGTKKSKYQRTSEVAGAWYANDITDEEANQKIKEISEE